MNEYDCDFNDRQLTWLYYTHAVNSDPTRFVKWDMYARACKIKSDAIINRFRYASTTLDMSYNSKTKKKNRCFLLNDFTFFFF